MPSLIHEGVIALVRDQPAFAASLLRELPPEQRLLYSMLIERALSEAARKAMEMEPQVEKFFSEAHRRSYDRGKAEG